MKMIQEWLMSWGTPGAIGAAAILALVTPIAADVLSTGAVTPPSPELWDRIASPAGATILGVVVIIILSRMLQTNTENTMKLHTSHVDVLRDELRKKDELLMKMLDQYRGKD